MAAQAARADAAGEATSSRRQRADRRGSELAERGTVARARKGAVWWRMHQQPSRRRVRPSSSRGGIYMSELAARWPRRRRVRMRPKRQPRADGRRGQRPRAEAGGRAPLTAVHAPRRPYATADHARGRRGRGCTRRSRRSRAAADHFKGCRGRGGRGGCVDRGDRASCVESRAAGAAAASLSRRQRRAEQRLKRMQV
jgi:hypothetical protein